MALVISLVSEPIGRLWAAFARSALGRFLAAYLESQVSNYASGVAFNAFVAVFPVILGLLAVLGYLVQDRHSLLAVQSAIVSTFPADSQSTLTRTLAGVKENRAAFGLLALGGLVWSGTNFFASMEFALNQIYGVRGRDFLKQRLLGVQMIAVFLGAIGASVVLNAALPGFGFLSGWLIMTALLYVIYRVVPNARIQHREAWPGALLAGLGIEVLTLAFPLYYSLTHQINVLGRGFGLIFLLLTWAYLLSHLLLLGAVINRLRLAGRVPKLKHTAPVGLAEHGQGGGVKV
jgi:membrane protein